MSEHQPRFGETLKIKLLGSTSKVPTQATPGSVAFDCYADLGGEGRTSVLGRGDQEVVHLGFGLKVPVGYAAVLAPRSGLGSKGLVLANTVGIIDQDYTDPVMAVLKNTSSSHIHTITHGDRICQMLLVKIDMPTIEVVETLEATTRTGGFGSTGTK